MRYDNYQLFFDGFDIFGSPSRHFPFFIPEAGQVNMHVYDLNGRTVGTVINDFLEPGFHQTVFHADQLAAGIYPVELEMDHFSDKKMILLK